MPVLSLLYRQVVMLMMIPTRHGLTHVQTAGDPARPPLVIFHGWGIHNEEAALHWDFDRLTPHFHLICPDAPGHSGRSQAHDIPTRSAAYGEWCADVLDGLGIERAALAGNSGGAFMALKFATYAPHRVTALCLSNPSGIVPHRISMAWVWAMLPLLLYPTEQAARRFVRLMNTAAMPAWQQEKFTTTLYTVYRQRKLMRYNPVVLPDSDIARLTMPVTIALGEFHPICPPDALERRMTALCPQVDIRRLPDAGHILSAAQQSGLVLAALTDA